MDKYEVYAVRYATLADFRVSSLIAGADPARRLDIAMMIWVLKGIDGRIAVVDTGFHRERYFRQFNVKDYVTPSEAIAPLGISEPRFLIPGHDPAVFDRFTRVNERIVRIVRIVRIE